MHACYVCIYIYWALNKPISVSTSHLVCCPLDGNLLKSFTSTITWSFVKATPTDGDISSTTEPALCAGVVHTMFSLLIHRAGTDVVPNLTYTDNS